MSDLTAFLTAVAGASGALVGLLFVAASVSRDDIVGPDASVHSRARSTLALSALVTPLIVSLLALIPAVGIRVPILVAGISGILFTAAAIRRIASSRGVWHGWRQLVFLIGFGVVSVVEVVVGSWLQIDPGWSLGPTIAAAALIVLIGIGIDRAWELIGGRRSNWVRSISDIVLGEQGAVDPGEEARPGTTPDQHRAVGGPRRTAEGDHPTSAM
jgi:hypothetical protein